MRGKVTINIIDIRTTYVVRISMLILSLKAALMLMI